MNASDVAKLFYEEDFRWHMRFQRGEMRSFFAPGPDHSQTIAERRHWLTKSPEQYAALLPGAVPVLNEAIELSHTNQALTPEQAATLKQINDPLQKCIELGCTWESDFVLLAPNTTGSLVVSGGVVCFPTAWSLPEKVGKPMQAVHTPVPKLNEALGRQIDLFLSKLRPGTVWLRSNWGLASTPERNQHPGRHLPRITSPVQLENIFLRVERQLLIALPQSCGVLFGIRIEQLVLSEVAKHPEANRGLAHSLRTMEIPVVQYKGFAHVRDEVIALLEAARLTTNDTNKHE